MRPGPHEADAGLAVAPPSGSGSEGTVVVVVAGNVVDVVLVEVDVVDVLVEVDVVDVLVEVDVVDVLVEVDVEVDVVDVLVDVLVEVVGTLCTGVTMSAVPGARVSVCTTSPSRSVKSPPRSVVTGVEVGFT